MPNYLSDSRPEFKPARVASDTRKGLAALARLEARRRQGGTALGLR